MNVEWRKKILSMESLLKRTRLLGEQKRKKVSFRKIGKETEPFSLPFVERWS